MTTIGSRELSPRQREILALVAAGRTSKEIAGELGISESTVNWHLANAFERLGASSRAEAVALAMRDEAERSSADGSGGAEMSAALPSRAARRATLPVSSIALAFALTLLVGLLSGAVIAGRHLIPAVPFSSPAPTASNTPSTAPQTPTPTGVRAPEQETAAPVVTSTPATGTSAPRTVAPAPRTVAPARSASAIPSVPAFPTFDAVVTLPPLPSLPPRLLTVP